MAEQGLFGLSPMEVEQQQQKSLHDRAMAMGKMDANQWANYGLMSGTAGLAQMLGAKNPVMENAQRTEQIMGAEGTDLTSSQGLFAKADEFRKAGDLRTAAALTMKAQELKRQEAEAKYKNAQTLRAEAQAEQANALAERALRTDESKNLPPEVQAMMALEKMPPDSPTAKSLRQWIDNKIKGKGEWSEPYKLDGATVVKNLVTGEPKVVVSRPPVTNINTGRSADGMTPAQRGKLAKESRDALANTLNIDNETAETISQIKLVQQHEGGASATGPIAGRIGNWRESTVDYENQLEGAKGKLTKIAKDLMSESGKIGSMQVQEWQILLNTIAAINPKMGQENINIALDNVVADLERKRDVHYAKLQQKYGSEEAPIEKPALKVPQKSSQYVKGGATATGKPAAADKFVVGKQYKDAKGNVATYLGNGQWK